MSFSYTTSQTSSFTVTHARHLAAKVATDLKRLQRFYGYPSDSNIEDYEAEVVQLLKGGYLKEITYGFRRNGDWIEPTLQYTARNLVGSPSSDDDPGKVRPGANVNGASFYSYLKYSDAWFDLSTSEREAFKKDLPFNRSNAPEPAVNGYMRSDHTYSSGGRALDRSTLRS